jgi:hypothetical protein
MSPLAFLTSGEREKLLYSLHATLAVGVYIKLQTLCGG